MNTLFFLINAFIQATRRLNMTVRGVGSFEHAQLVGLDVDLKIHLIDPEEARVAWAQNLLPRGAHVMFNGGCLLRPVGAAGWERDNKRLDALAALQREAALEYSTYTQEGSASPIALAAQGDASSGTLRLVHDNGEVEMCSYSSGGWQVLCEWHALVSQLAGFTGPALRHPASAPWRSRTSAALC